jgi:hypothetical protein
MTERLKVAIEGTRRKVFASALEWPGWSRSGKTPEAAIETLLAYAPRYEPVVLAAGLTLGTSFAVDVVEHLEGGSGTEFGVPSLPTADDARSTDAAEAARLAAIVEASWAEFDRIAASAPGALRKGPRGGGRDRDKMVGHVNEADWYYAREIGIRDRKPAAGDRTAVEALRTAMLEILRQPSDGRSLGDRKWPARYAARRIAWHALDHAWEIQDRST